MIRTTKEQKLTNTRRDLRETENFASEENFTRMFDVVVVSHLKMGTWCSALSDRTQPRRFVVRVSSAASEEEELSSGSDQGPLVWKHPPPLPPAGC